MAGAKIFADLGLILKLKLKAERQSLSGITSSWNLSVSVSVCYAHIVYMHFV